MNRNIIMILFQITFSMTELMAFTTKHSRVAVRRNRHIEASQTAFRSIRQLQSTASFAENSESATSHNNLFSNNNDNVLRPLIVCGPSGVGKGTIISNYMNNFAFAQNFGFTTSHTTRDPRPGEIDGIDYHFLSRPRMENAIKEGKFIEYAQVHGNLYGTSFDAIRHVQENLQKICLLDIDIQGIKNIKNHEIREEFPTVKSNCIFIAPPSMHILEERLKGRGTESEESLKMRTLNAKEEMQYGMGEGNFDYIIINDDLEQASRNFDMALREIYQDLI